MKLYRHQYLAIIYFICSGIIFLIYLFLTDESKINAIISSLLEIFIGLLDSINIILIKKLMNETFISPMKITALIGLVNTIIMSILLLFFTYLPCNSDLCAIEYNNKKYFYNIVENWSQYDNIHIIFIIILPLFCGAMKFLNTTIINSYTIYHSFFTLFTDSLDVIFNMVQLFTFEMFRLMLYFLPVYLLGFIMVLIFLEIIELNFCGFNENLKINIEKRAQNDAKKDISENTKVEISEGYYADFQEKDELCNDNILTDKFINN